MDTNGKPKRSTKSKTAHRSTKSRPSEKKASSAGIKEVVLTLSMPKGNVVKIEKVEKLGHRQALSDEELAMFVGEDEMDDLGSVLEEAYAAGIADALGEKPAEDTREDELEEGESDDEAFGDFMLRLLARHRLVRRGVRRLVLRRMVASTLVRSERPQRKTAKPQYERH